MDAKQSIVDQVVASLRKKVANQTLYQMSTPALESVWDDWYDHVDSMKSEDVDWACEQILAHPICDYDRMCQLAADMTIEELYDNDNWVDPVADYIYTFTQEHDCEGLVRAIAARTGWSHEV